MDLNKVFGTDKNLEEEGVWVDLGDESKIKIARMGNIKSRERATKLQKSAKLANKYSIDNFNEEDLADILAYSVIKDWKGIKDNGEDLPYSFENAKAMILKYRDFRDMVVELSTEMETFRKVDIEEGKKNIKKS
jgi:hypothetical protein